jgi:LuxR family maltose regulon positive regulatory protein
LLAQRDVATLVASLGSHRHVFDYLIEEVLQRQPEPVQRFLLETCFLERLCAPLCDAVRGQGGSQALLELLERHNLFIVPLDEERRWYRYHYLFAESLRHHLERAEPGNVQPVRLLHQRAAAWYEENGLTGEAVEHALAPGDQARAAQLIEQTAWTALARRETATVLRWLAALPAATLEAHPRLYLHQAWALVLSEHLEAAEDCLKAVAPLLKSESGDAEMPNLHGEVTGVRAWIATLRGKVRQAVELSRHALELLPERDSPVRSAVVFNLASAYWKAGDVVRASQMEMEVAARARAANDVPVVICALANQAELQRVQGHLHQAHALFQQALSLAQERGLRSAACAGFPCLGLGTLLYEWNRLDEAADYILRALELGQQSGEQLVLLDSPLMLAKVKLAQGDASGALALVQRGEHPPVQANAARHSGREEAHRAWIALLQNDLRAAGRWGEECGLDVEDDMDQINMREFEYLVLARMLIAQGRSDPTGRQLERALHLLPRVLAGAEASGRAGSVIEILMLEALAYGARGARHRALEALAQALTRAEPEGYLRLFLDEGEPMQALLRQAVARGIAPAYGTELLAAWAAEAMLGSTEARQEMAETIVEPLSERELALQIGRAHV